MIKDNIIKLNNGVSYYILEEITYNDKRYAMAAECNLENETVNEDKYIVMELIVNDVGIMTADIEDDELAKKVTALLIKKIRESD